MNYKVKETLSFAGREKIPRMKDKTKWEELSGMNQSSKRT